MGRGREEESLRARKSLRATKARKSLRARKPRESLRVRKSLRTRKCLRARKARKSEQNVSKSEKTGSLARVSQKIEPASSKPQKIERVSLSVSKNRAV